MRRKRSSSPLMNGGAASPHRATRASSRSPRVPASKAIITPVRGSPHSPKCELNGHVKTSPRSRHTSDSPSKVSPNNVNGIKDINSCFRRSSRVSKGLNYHENESDEDKDDDESNSEHESRDSSVRRENNKRENHALEPTYGKRTRIESKSSIRSKPTRSFVTTDEVSK